MILTKKFYKRLNIITIIAVYFLILVGGIVRSTGSGMGCPDWPKCFGQYVPPTSVDQLPSNYKEIYKEKRLSKNQRVAGMLSKLGFTGVAQNILNDPNIENEQDFNVVETWIEYINRLIGVAIGLLITAVFITSFFMRKYSKSVVFYSFAAFFLVVFQGWLGSIVVSTNLLPGIITAHMVLSMVLVCLLIYSAYQFAISNESKPITTGKGLKVLKSLLIVSLIVFLVQIALGTQLREAIDAIALSIQDRTQWISNLGNIFLVHRSYSWLVLILQLAITWMIFKNQQVSEMKFIAYGLTALIVFEVLAGTVLAYAGMPAFMQPVHLFLATLIFGVQFYALLFVNTQYKLNLVTNE